MDSDRSSDRDDSSLLQTNEIAVKSEEQFSQNPKTQEMRKFRRACQAILIDSDSSSEQDSQPDTINKKDSQSQDLDLTVTEETENEAQDMTVSNSQEPRDMTDSIPIESVINETSPEKDLEVITSSTTDYPQTSSSSISDQIITVERETEVQQTNKTVQASESQNNEINDDNNPTKDPIPRAIRQQARKRKLSNDAFESPQKLLVLSAQNESDVIEPNPEKIVPLCHSTMIVVNDEASRETPRKEVVQVNGELCLENDDNPTHVSQLVVHCPNKKPFFYPKSKYGIFLKIKGLIIQN